MRLFTILARRGGDGIPVGGGGSPPDAPTMLETSGSLVGQMTVLFSKPNFLRGTDNDPIADAPVTNTAVYASASWQNAEDGVSSHSGSAGTAEQLTLSGVAAGTWYVTAVSTNANGAGYRSHVLTVVVT